MTDPRKPRWTAQERRDARAGGVERRAKYAGDTEVRRFHIGMTDGPTTRANSSNSAAITIVGSPIVYGVSYAVFDGLGPTGSFQETVQPGALTAALATSDTKFKYDHTGLVMARVSSGTLTLTDGPQFLMCQANLDPRQGLAADLAIAIGRGDVSQMSVSFAIAPDGDQWNDDFSQRTITRFKVLFDVSAVGDPASPTTSLALSAAPEYLQPIAGDDGTLGGGGGNAPGIGSQDGTGSRSRDVARLVQIDSDLMRLRRPGVFRTAAKYTQSQIDEMGKKGQAFGPDKDGHYSYPIADHEDVKNAVKAVGMGNADHDKIRAYIIKQASKIGASHLIPLNWKSDGTLKQSNSSALAFARFR